MELNLSLGNTGRLTELQEARGMISLMRGEGSAAHGPAKPPKASQPLSSRTTHRARKQLPARRRRRRRPETPSSRNPTPRAAWVAPQRRTQVGYICRARGTHGRAVIGSLAGSPRLTFDEIWAILFLFVPSLSLSFVKWACIYVGTPIGGDHVRRRQGRGGGSEGGKALPLSLSLLSTWSPKGVVSGSAFLH